MSKETTKEIKASVKRTSFISYEWEVYFFNFYFNTISNCLTGGIWQEFKAEQEHKVCVMRLAVPIIWDDTTHIVFNIC